MSKQVKPKMKTIEMTVRGLLYYVTPETLTTIAEVTPMAVYLEREPRNAFDSNAIKVILDVKPWKNFHIGHVAKQTAAVLAPKMDAGVFHPTEARLMWVDADTGEAGVVVKVLRDES